MFPALHSIKKPTYDSHIIGRLVEHCIAGCKSGKEQKQRSNTSKPEQCLINRGQFARRLFTAEITINAPQREQKIDEPGILDMLLQPIPYKKLFQNQENNQQQEETVVFPAYESEKTPEYQSNHQSDQQIRKGFAEAGKVIF